MQKRVVVQQVEVTRDGNVQVKLLKQVLDENGAVMMSEPHRCSAVFDSDFAATRAGVDANLVAMGWPTPEAAEWLGAEQLAAVAWKRTPPPDSDELAARQAASTARDAALVAPLQSDLANAHALLGEARQALAAAQAEIERLQAPAPQIVLAN